MRYFSLTVILAALGVAGCVQMQIADLRKRCDFANDPRFEVLRGKFPLSPTEVENPPTLAEISNNDRPTPKERAAIFEYDREGSVCARDALDIASRAGSESVVGLFRETRLAIVNLMKLLADGQIKQICASRPNLDLFAQRPGAGNADYRSA